LKKLLLACLSGLLLASPAFATKYYVAPTTASPPGSPSNTGLSPSVPWDIATANSSVAAGDIVFLARGTYTTTGIAPSVSGTNAVWSQRVAYLGDTLNPSLVIIPSITWKPYLLVKGIYSTGALSINQSGVELGYSKFVNSTNVNLVTVSCDSVYIHDITYTGKAILLGSTIASSWCTQYPSFPSISGMVMSDCTFDLTNSSGNVPMTKWAGVVYSQFTRCYFKAVQNGDGGMLKTYGMLNCNFTDCRWNLTTNVSISQNESGMVYFRDYTQYCRFVRDTIDFQPGSLAAGVFYLTASGSCTGGNTDNYYDRCVFRADNLGNNQGFMTTQNAMRRDTMTHCIVISKNVMDIYSGDTCNNGYSWVDGNYFANNTFIRIGSTPAVYLDASTGSCMSGTNRFRSNIVYSTANNSSAPRLLTTYYPSSGGSPLKRNYNLYYSVGGSASQALFVNSTYLAVASGWDCSTFENDCQGAWGDPKFRSIGTSWVGIDPRLQSSSPAIGADTLGGTIGAIPRFYWVAPDSGVLHVGTEFNGGADSSNCISLYLANRIAKAGDLFVLMPGRYDLNRPNITPVAGSYGAAAGIYFDNNNSIFPGRPGGAADSVNALRYYTLW
jgi:hypothetical protein